ncbi:MAG: hypothetical protein ACRDZ4_08325 [Egibacteraceae bacterium]
MTTTAGAVRTYKLDLGKVDARGRGRKANRVTLEIELRHKANVAPYLDTDLNPVREYTELAICGSVWNPAGTGIESGGQNTEAIRERFPDDADVQRLCALWDRWHLNGMKAGTRAQEAFLRDARVENRLAQYDENCKVLEKANLLHVTGPQGRNYKYGAAWLVERLPEDVEREVVELCERLQQRAKAVPKGPADFAEEHGIKATAEKTDRNPYMRDATGDHWKVTLRRGQKSMTLPYTKGFGHNGAPPTAIEVLGCLASDARGVDNAGGFEAWARELGFDPDSRDAERTYKACEQQAKRLKALLGADLYERLLEES